VAACVLVLHLAVVAAILRTAPPEVEAGGQTVMVSFVSEAASEPVSPVPPPPAVLQEAPPVLATERRVEADAAPPTVTEAAAPVVPPVTTPSAPAEVAAPAPSDAVPAALPPATTPPSFGAAYLNNPRPAYPMVSRRLKEEGVTLLRVEVGADGRPQQVLIEHGSGSDRLDRAARMAVRDWRFVPAREGDKAVSGWVTVPIIWKVEN
jgi:protein TonB